MAFFGAIAQAFNPIRRVITMVGHFLNAFSRNGSDLIIRAVLEFLQHQEMKMVVEKLTPHGIGKIPIGLLGQKNASELSFGSEKGQIVFGFIVDRKSTRLNSSHVAI